MVCVRHCGDMTVVNCTASFKDLWKMSLAVVRPGRIYYMEIINEIKVRPENNKSYWKATDGTTTFVIRFFCRKYIIKNK